MNWLDIAILTVVAISAVMGLRRGFVREVTSLVIWSSLLVVALFIDDFAALSQQLSKAVAPHTHSALVLAAAVFIVIISVSVLGYLFGKLVMALGMVEVNRILGMLLGVARGTLLTAIAVVLLPIYFPVAGTAVWQQSNLVSRFLTLEDTLLDWVTKMTAWLDGLIVGLIY